MRLSLPSGELTLERHPVGDRTLRAWDAADEYALAHLDELGPRVGSTLLVNDAFGALATGVTAQGGAAVVDSWSDSFVSHLATTANLERNGIDPSAVCLVADVDDLSGPDGSVRYDTVVVKIPRHLSLLEHQLRSIAPLLAPGAAVIGAGMTKHIHTSTIELFEQIVGPTSTSLAKKKARLIQCEPTTRDGEALDGEALGVEGPEPWITYALARTGETVTSAPGVFSSSKLDGGTAFFLEHLPKREGPDRVVDLGCGNGVVGMIAARRNPDAELTFVDESFLAVRSAEITFRANLGGDREARFVVGDGLSVLGSGEPIAPGSVDLVLNNPPFHTNNAISDATAWQMFSDAHRALRSGGELWVVGNRHLAYHAKLKRLFGNCKVAASNSKFVVLQAIRA